MYQVRRIIVLCGRKGAGKDTVAQMIAEAACGRFAHLKFAGPMKRAMLTVFGLSSGEVEDPSLKDAPMERWGGATPRALMQWFGTDVMQHGLAAVAPRAEFGARMFWADQMRREIRALDPDTHVVISDARFAHEVAMLRDEFERSVFVVRVTRPGHNHDSDAAATDHESERSVDGIRCDAEIRNDGSMGKLRDEVHRVIILSAVAAAASLNECRANVGNPL